MTPMESEILKSEISPSLPPSLEGSPQGGAGSPAKVLLAVCVPPHVDDAAEASSWTSLQALRPVPDRVLVVDFASDFLARCAPAADTEAQACAEACCTAEYLALRALADELWDKASMQPLRDAGRPLDAAGNRVGPGNWIPQSKFKAWSCLRAVQTGMDFVFLAHWGDQVSPLALGGALRLLADRPEVAWVYFPTCLCSPSGEPLRPARHIHARGSVPDPSARGFRYTHGMVVRAAALDPDILADTATWQLYPDEVLFQRLLAASGPGQGLDRVDGRPVRYLLRDESADEALVARADAGPPEIRRAVLREFRRLADASLKARGRPPGPSLQARADPSHPWSFRLASRPLNPPFSGPS